MDDLSHDGGYLNDLLSLPNTAEGVLNKIKNKLFIPMPPIEELRNELRFHIQRFSFHKLQNSSKYLSELMVSLTDRTSSSTSSLQKRFMEENTDKSLRYSQTWREDISSKNYDNLLFARSLYDCRELKRCAYVLKYAESSYDCQSSLFLYNYSLYMQGYQRKEEEIFEKQKSKAFAGTKLAECTVINQQAKNLISNLERLFHQNLLDDLNTYLYGLLLVEVGKPEAAMKAFIKALNLNPCLWAAWQELAHLIVHEDSKTDSVDLLLMN